MSKVYVKDGITPGEIARELGISPANVVKKLFLKGVMAKANDPLDRDTAWQLVLELGGEPTDEPVEERTEKEPEEEKLEEAKESKVAEEKAFEETKLEESKSGEEQAQEEPPQEGEPEKPRPERVIIPAPESVKKELPRRRKKIKKSVPRKETQKAPEVRPRPVVVTLMGHVDHGKTSILDKILGTNIADREAGGITQHMRAVQVETPVGKITFIDTPGHEAFTTIRARGADVTDIIVLVIAATEGIKPQTVEAINHAKAAKVPIIVAINKIDLPGANPDKVKQELTKYDLVPEDWGGDVLTVNTSAITGEGIDELLEAIQLMAELLEPKAPYNVPANGVVLESRLDKGLGPVAWTLIKEGTLRRGDCFVVGATWGKVRTMLDFYGNQIKEATPSMPVLVSGLDEVAQAGDILEVVEDENLARELAEGRKEELEEQKRSGKKKLTLEEIFKNQEGKKKLNLILKADTQGSIEAIKNVLSKIPEKVSTDEVEIEILHEGIGAINESDVILAAASRAIVLGFYVKPDSKARKLAEQEGVQIRFYRIIYELEEDIKKAIAGLLEPEEKEVVLGEAEVRQVFKVPRVGNVAGCYVLSGLVRRNSGARLLREGVVVYEGRIDSLKRFKEDVTEVPQGYECGIKLANYDDIKVGDIIECFTVEKVQRAI